MMNKKEERSLLIFEGFRSQKNTNRFIIIGTFRIILCDLIALSVGWIIRDFVRTFRKFIE
jgi:hypothetical protein